MGNGVGDGDAASGRRCPKHPSQPSFTGFCSACLLDRLHATNLIGVASPSQPPPSLPLHQDDLEEPPPPCSTEAAGRRIGAERTTLLRLFQLEDQGREERAEDTNAAPSTSGGDGQDPPPHLQRKRSLRHSCSEWIACCDANHSSCIPSRQSLDASSTTSAAAAAAAAPAAGVAPAANPYPNDAAATSVAMVERRTGSRRWNELWAIKGLLAKPAGHLLGRSFSESSRSRYALHPGNGTGNIARSSSSQSQGIRLNGSRSVSSAGNGMDSSEISLPGDSVGHAHVHRSQPRLKDRLRWLRRSRSVHYSSPTRVVDAGLTPFRSRSSSTRSTSHKNHHRFAAGFFAAQRNQQ